LLLPELGFRAAWWFGPHQVPDGGLPLSLGAYVRPVWPVELGFGSVGGYGIGGAPQWYFTIGLSDVSGLAYWTYRALTETVEPHSSATTSASYHEQ
jgi:hypothetical protein